MKDKVISFFVKKMNKEIGVDSEINDMGYFGLDGWALMSDFFDEFEIRNSEDFEIYSFFVEELSFIDFMKKGYKKRIKEKNSLSINHLIKVAERKEWFDPIYSTS